MEFVEANEKVSICPGEYADAVNYDVCKGRRVCLTDYDHLIRLSLDDTHANDHESCYGHPVD
jgi:hypothetical protein